jgi:hypothetical protein
MTHNLTIQPQSIYFGLGDPAKQISKWSRKIEVTKWHSFWHKMKRDSRRKKSTIFKMIFCGLFKRGKFVQLKFI